MKRKSIILSIILSISFVAIFSITSKAISSNEEDFLKYLITKTYPELKEEKKSKGIIKIGANMLKKEDKEIENHKSEEFIKITVNDKKGTKSNNQIATNNKAVKKEKQTKPQVPQKVELVNGKPQILIYHTHGTESYEPERTGNYHSLNRKYSVLAVGEELKKNLEKKGYSVLHNQEYHDYPSFNGSYSRSLKTARGVLSKYDSIKFIFDIHRDGIDIKNEEMRSKVRKQETTTINGEKVARFSIVVGPESPNRKEVEKFANYIMSISNKKYPGLAKKVIVKPYGRFNQFLSNNYALIEIGGNANTIQESLNTAKYLSEILDEALKNMKR
ncbi:stage II sporulation protein P [Tepidibacter hydrothermalis]|uniref:Stage II sporulation protein P n=1 Tax=Tepidibacter hydrothermalis TaxID=3036126 RepID=A0ABY8EIN3_9FIRM|nr:stage II sporulation protein P [Tepidibacter hydrothermalis]WFD11569.1 stage II sporulation protein P [Tepidibacter hydrothermalis]